MRFDIFKSTVAALVFFTLALPHKCPKLASRVASAGSFDLEAEAIDAANAAINEHQFARSDWGSPGKNHQTIDDYND